MVSEGFTAAGYEFVSVDSCWAELERDVHGHVIANRTRFPSGMAALSDHIHARGLKFGLYSNMGISIIIFQWEIIHFKWKGMSLI